ncbi:hypothetical protein B5X24_HaOG207116 [Helicoverpa armigera]|uniref:Uncharacterized protein n=1 Tax=Helicoverpa armigera TaxID=29058 RepID=A0A2W1BIG8_HELAM|nr:hypothetical protein B5X24_HaOG207116 [Helicoverpa armigera]
MPSFPRRPLLDCVALRALESVRTVVTPGRLLTTDSMQVPPETTVSGEDLRHAVREGAVTPPEPLLKEGIYRHYGGLPCAGLRQSLPPVHHEIAPELRDNLPRQRGFPPVLCLLAQEDSPPEPTVAVRLVRKLLRGRSCGTPGLAYWHVQVVYSSRPYRTCPYRGPIKGHGPHDPHIEFTAGGRLGLPDWAEAA